MYPREVVKLALQCNAAALILSHNHPSGNPTPSTADVTLTRHLRDALQLVNIRLLDHIVIGVDGTTSMVESGLGISLLPELILQRIPYQLSMKALDIPATRTIGIAIKNHTAIPLVVKKFLEYLPHRYD